MRIESGDHVITTLDEWERWAPPKAREHWKAERSAYELARAWCGAGSPAVPEVVKEILDSRPETRGLAVEIAYPERRIPFDSLKGEPCNGDLAFVGNAGAGRVAVLVEAKADEPFGDTVGVKLLAGLEAVAANPTSGAIKRIDSLVAALFHERRPGAPRIDALRYQLLTATAGAIAFAESQQADTAVLLIHEFKTEATADAKHAQNAADLEAFLFRLCGEAVGAQSNRVIGPIVVPGKPLFTGERKIFIGKITTNRRRIRELIHQQGRRFRRYVGIDYSGAETPTASLKGLRVYAAEAGAPPTEVMPPPGLRRYWTRRGIAEWLVERLSEDVPTLVGIDHGFSFPIDYFAKFGVEQNWKTFLDDFCAHWPTDQEHTYVDFIRDGAAGTGAVRLGNTRWRRLTEKRSKTGKSLFHFDVQGSVAKSTHAGLPWLRFIRDRATRRVHFWPFDGWDIPDGTSAIVEVYPRLWNKSYPMTEPTADQHDAWVIAAWLRQADESGELLQALAPLEDPAERRLAEVEGWILGVK